VHIDKLSNTGAFVVIDLDDAPTSVGIVRVAPKVLQGSATALARTTTYTFAARELKVGGASAGISADPDRRDELVGSFVADVTSRVESGTLVLDPGPGVADDALVSLSRDSTRNAVRHEAVEGSRTLEAHLAGLGPVVAAEAALGSLDGRTAAVELGPTAPALVDALVARGARVVAVGGPKGSVEVPGGIASDALGNSVELADLGEVRPSEALLAADATVLFCGSRQGMIDGAAAESLAAQLVVPTGCQPLSAKGLAVLRRRGIVALADFVSTAAPSFAWWPAGDASVDGVVADATTGIAELVTGTLGHDEGPVLGACYRAEAFLCTWQDRLPFGRPLA
jgi:glutamate dehydrogenase/leucine dehydrogenase